MSKGDADIEMNFKVGGAAAANAIVRSVYQNNQAMMRQTARQNDMLGMSIRKVGRSMAFGVAGYAGVTGVNAIFSSLNQGVKEFINKRTEMETAITPLLSLGDNVGNMQGIRDEVTRTSISMGRSIQEVAGFMFDLQSTTGNLSASIRDGLKKTTLDLAKITGGDLVTAQNLMTKSYQISGKEVRNLTELQNKLMYTQEQAAVRFDELATRAPELLATGQVVGVTFNEVMASIIGATKKSGSIEKTFTGMRNVFLLMERAEQKGVKLTGSYIQKLGQLRGLFQTNSAAMQKLFGQEAVVAAQVLSESVDDVTASLTALEKITGDVSVAQEKLREKMSDPSHFQTRKIQMIEDTIATAPNRYMGDDTWGMWMAERMGYGRASAAEASGGLGGPTWTNIVGGAGGLLSTKVAAEGREIVMSQAGDAEFMAMQREKHFKDAAARSVEYQRQLKISEATHIGGNPNRKNALTREQIEERFGPRELSPHLMFPDELTARRIRGGAGPAAGMDTKALEENTKAMKGLTEAMGRITTDNTRRVPGGGRTNSQETL